MEIHQVEPVLPALRDLRDAGLVGQSVEGLDADALPPAAQVTPQVASDDQEPAPGRAEDDAVPPLLSTPKDGLLRQVLRLGGIVTDALETLREPGEVDGELAPGGAAGLRIVGGLHAPRRGADGSAVSFAGLEARRHDSGPPLENRDGVTWSATSCPEPPEEALLVPRSKPLGIRRAAHATEAGRTRRGPRVRNASGRPPQREQAPAEGSWRAGPRERVAQVRRMKARASCSQRVPLWLRMTLR